jgi:predicted porin
MAVMLAAGVMVAQADVTLSGQRDASLSGLDQPDGSGDQSPVCATCSIGFDGSEDLGNGLKAIYRLDWQYDGNSGTGPAGRDQWLGVSGNFGEVKVGTMSTRYKSEGATPDPIYRTTLPMSERAVQSNRSDHKVDKDEGVGLSYENAGILVFADYIAGKSANEDTAYKVGAKYTMSNFAVFGQYKLDPGPINNEKASISSDAGDGADLWFLGGSVTLGNNSIYAGYGKGDDGVSASALPADYNSWEIVGVHTVGKLTSVYAGYSGTGCVDKNPDVCNKAGTDGGEDDKFSLGIRHKF